MKVHWQNQGQMKLARAHCGAWWPKYTTAKPDEVTCKNCIARGFDYNGRGKDGCETSCGGHALDLKTDKQLILTS